MAAADTSRYESVLDLIKEEVHIIDDDEEEAEEEIGEEENEEDDEEPYLGEGLFAFEEYDEAERDDDVPDRDPLSTDAEYETIVLDDEDENDENIEMKQSYLPFLQELQKDLQDLEEEESHETQVPFVITAVSSLRVASVAGNTNPRPASFRNLDVFRCFLCKKDFNTFDDFILHRTKTKKHAGVPYDAEHEKAFACGICQRPWNQPRKALACAVYGHDPSQIHEAMFIHSCPLCPDTHLAYHSLAAVGRHWSQMHCDRPLPPFLIFCTGNDQLPSIKVSLQQISSVSESMTREKPSLVLENCSSNDTRLSPNTCKKELKVYKCSECERNFETRREVEIHDCSAKSKSSSSKKVPVVIQSPRSYKCEDCGRKFSCGRNFRFHLLRAGACKSDGEVKRKDFPYKCIFCGSRYNSFKSYSSHRLKGHAEVPYNPAFELPFACKICQKPAFVQKEAMICALFGHDPSGLRRAMFKYKCSQCVSFGFHSPFALKRHWEKEHPKSEMPSVLQATKVDKPLPNVTISLDQLLSLKGLQDFGATLVVEREIHPSLAKFVRMKSAFQTENTLDQATFTLGLENSNNTLEALPSKSSVETANVLSMDKIENPEIIRKSIVEESVEKNMCVICNKSFKDIRRHLKVHDQSRFSGAPKNKCVCGKEYHLRNSLHSHWKKNKHCKLQYAKENGVKISDIDDAGAVETKPDTSSQEYVLKIPSPAHSPFEDLNIKVEAPELRAVVIPEPEEMDVTQYQSITSVEVMDLYSEYEKFDAENSVPDETIDLRNFIHLEVEEVQDDCDNNTEGDSVIVNSNGDIDIPVIEPKKPRVSMCVICNTGFPNQVMFLDHMAKEHKDSHRFACRHCGKRFKLNDQRNKHETIHDSTRFNGDPKFACDKCDRKYHLKSSLETHRKVKHLGYVKPQSRTHLPIVQHRSIGAGRKAGDSLQNSHDCTECGAKFNFKYLLQQHIVRVHTERPFKCELCHKRFSEASTLSLHTKRAHEMAGKSGPLVKKKVQKKSGSTDGKNFSCNKCPRSFTKPYQLEQHRLIHTGEKPHVCDHCGRSFRLRKSMKAHKRIHELTRKDDRDNLFKCCVCGRHDFVRANDLHRHRLRKHKNIHYDRKREKAFGCGVCQKPYLLRTQAMVCAILGHDPTRLQEAMFKHKCPECSEERLGYHSVSSLRNHWNKEHSNIRMPARFLPNPQNATDSLPCITISKEKAAEIKSGDLPEKYDFPLVVEFDLICLNPTSKKFAYSPPPEIELESEDDSSESGSPTEEELLMSTVITLNDALEAAKAVVTIQSSQTAVPSSNTRTKLSPKSKRKRKSGKMKEESAQDSLAADRALGNRRIARVLERIRTARARKAGTREST